MGRADFLELGSWNIVCFRCGKKAKASQSRKQWQGYYVCDRPGCFEPRQPQDFVRGLPDIQAPPWVQPPSGDIFVTTCSPSGVQAVPGLATAGCMIPSSFNPNILPGAYDFCTISGSIGRAGEAEAGCWIVGKFQ